ncbi:transporter substrate-binding domain-containing protein [Pseudomonas sp. NPDC089734]|uniref:transporter substrate-binding domain-containing protein n=1 Tax=Pseudomonas sp. NPDC089734 TaxID=3364469 RepID=UPI0037F391D8
MLKKILFFSLAVSASTMSVVSAQNLPAHITIATEGSYAPWAFTKPDGSLSGYEIDLANKLCERMRVKCDIVDGEWKSLIPGLILGKYDAIMAAMGVTEERKKVVAFSEPYAKSPNGFYTIKDGAVEVLPGSGLNFDLTSNAQDAVAAIDAARNKLEGKVIGVQTGSTAAYFLKEYFKDFDVREYPTFDQLGLELSSGRIDVAVASVTAFKAAIDANPSSNFVPTGPTFQGGVLGQGTTNVALSQSNLALREAFNSAIQSLNDDGTNKALAEKWFGVDVSTH